MICQRCGTEFDNGGYICPRCGFGRPKVKKKLPLWARWLIFGGGSVAVVAGIVVAFVLTYFNDDWMHGSWEGSSLSISFNTAEDSFLLTNGDTILYGDFVADKNSFTLTAEDGTIYIYRYERVNFNKIKVLFNQGDETKRVTLKRLTYENEEFLNEDESLVE